MSRRTFAAVLAAFDVFLGVVPCATGVAHEDGHQNAAYQSTCQKSAQSLNAQQNTYHKRRGNRTKEDVEFFGLALDGLYLGQVYDAYVAHLACPHHAQLLDVVEHGRVLGVVD